MSDSTLTKTPSGFSRRNFLETTGAAGAMGMMGSSLLSFGAAAAVPPSGTVLTGSHWGAFRAKVEGGRVVGYTPWEKDLFPSPQLKGVIDSIYSATRIKYRWCGAHSLKKAPAQIRPAVVAVTLCASAGIRLWTWWPKNLRELKNPRASSHVCGFLRLEEPRQVAQLPKPFASHDESQRWLRQQLW